MGVHSLHVRIVRRADSSTLLSFSTPGDVDPRTLLSSVVAEVEGGTDRDEVVTPYELRRFERETNPIGTEVMATAVEVEGHVVDLEIWAVGGAEPVLKPSMHLYRRPRDCMVMVYDITRRPTFTHLVSYLEDPMVRAEAPPSLKWVLIGNKADGEGERQVPTEEVAAYAAQHGMEFYETSALDGTSVQEVFLSPTRELVREVLAGERVVRDADTFTSAVSRPE
ncbi:small GTPase superfamily, Ras type [Kipferlia bialata]|uniref:Small GTPase superfamily, Ras type n=1 Tax=Kipferlia bialata TaxID=797122 RepID=A0A9K3CW26_9EUKA|nr:small GTPase superfamily, Ras type [Kipferlia bialata]|eukprot:g5475.t1